MIFDNCHLSVSNVLLPTSVSCGNPRHFSFWGVSTNHTKKISNMNIFRLAGDFSHLLAIILLLLKIWTTRSCAGKQFSLTFLSENKHARPAKYAI